MAPIKNSIETQNMKKIIWLLLGSVMISAVGYAQEGLEEVIVTAQRREDVRIPATSLKRQADFLLMTIGVFNDSRDYKTRRDEIYTTLRAVLAAADKDQSIELSVIRDEDIVLPLKLDDASLNFTDTGIGGVLQTTINIKARIGSGGTDGIGSIAKLKSFISSVKPAGRTKINYSDETQVSVVNIAQYRDPVIQLLATDIKKITTALGGDYRVVVRGLDQPIQWVRSGTLDVTIFIPYGYDVVPTTISSYAPARAERGDDD